MKRDDAILEKIRYLIARGEVRISLHGYDELVTDGIIAPVDKQ
jgi:hypothetical protein